MEASRRARRITNEKKAESDALDPELWCKLQDHIPLHTLYQKLPQQELFRLRLVSKEWSHAALQRVLPNPYFVTITPGVDERDGWDVGYLNGILTHDIASNRSRFQRQRFRLLPVDSHVPPFAVDGLILCHNPDDLHQRGVFNAHTQTWHPIPPPPETTKSLSACGLMVDTSQKPYSFKLIQGNVATKTQIYDSKSRSWSATSSRLLRAAASHLDTRSYSCVCNDGAVWISIGATMILKYSMKEDVWTTVKFPAVTEEEEHITLGVWDGRMFTTRENCKQHRVVVWELVDPEKQQWVEYARSSVKQYGWLMVCDFAHHGPSIYEEMCLKSFFCGGYLLVCCWQWGNARADALVLFDMATKEWKKVRLPMGTVATHQQEIVDGEAFAEDPEDVEDVEDADDVEDDVEEDDDDVEDDVEEDDDDVEEDEDDDDDDAEDDD